MKTLDIRHVIGDKLRLMRLEAKLTQEGLAELANVERSLISDLERGVSNPSLYFFMRVAWALGDHPGNVLEEVLAAYAAAGGTINGIPAGVKARGGQAKVRGKVWLKNKKVKK